MPTVVEALEVGSLIFRIPENIWKSIPKIIQHFEQVSPKSRNFCIPIPLKFHSVFPKVSHIPLDKCAISLYPYKPFKGLIVVLICVTYRERKKALLLNFEEVRLFNLCKWNKTRPVCPNTLFPTQCNR